MPSGGKNRGIAVWSAHKIVQKAKKKLFRSVEWTFVAEQGVFPNTLGTGLPLSEV